MDGADWEPLTRQPQHDSHASLKRPEDSNRASGQERIQNGLLHNDSSLGIGRVEPSRPDQFQPLRGLGLSGEAGSVTGPCAARRTRPE